MDIDALWENIESHMEGSAERPAYSYRKHGPLLTLFSENCGQLIDEKSVDIEGGAPSLSLKFDGPAGRIIVVNASLPPLPTIKKAGVLTEYVAPAIEEKSHLSHWGTAD